MAMNGKIDGIEALHGILGEIDDLKAVQILALEPTAEELEVALLWASGSADIVSTRGATLSGKTGQIFEILTAGEEDDGP